MLPAFASTDDLDVRLPGGLNASDEDRAQAALDDASALIRSEAGIDWVDDDALRTDFPAVLRVICITAARRELENPDGIISETIDGYSQRLANASTGVYLTPKEVRVVRRCAGRSGLWSLGTTRGVVETPACDPYRDAGNDVYLDVVGSEPIPYLPG
jgi:hypothetical protein